MTTIVKRNKCHRTTAFENHCVECFPGFSRRRRPVPTHPQESVGSTELKPSRRSLLEDGELVAEGQDLRFELGARVEAGPNRRK
jgi:hypothetical protein